MNGDERHTLADRLQAEVRELREKVRVVDACAESECTRADEAEAENGELRAELDGLREELRIEGTRADKAEAATRDVDLIRRAISDPGQFLPRGDNYTEAIPAWSARAVVAALGGVS